MGQSITLAIAAAAAAAPTAQSAPAAQKAAAGAPAFNPEQVHLAIIEQSDKALNAISSANSVMSTALTALGIMLPFAVALAVFLFNRAVKDAAKAAAAEARIQLEAQAREAIATVKGDAAEELKKAVDEARLNSAAEIELMSSQHEKKLEAIHADATAQADLNKQQFMDAQASYRAQLDVEYSALKSEMRTRLDEIAEEQISRLEELVKKLPESNEAQIQAFFAELRTADEDRKKQLEARVDAMVKAQRVGVPTVAQKSSNALFNATLPASTLQIGDNFVELSPSVKAGVNSLAEMAKAYRAVDWSDALKVTTGPKLDVALSPALQVLHSQGIVDENGRVTPKANFPTGIKGET